MYNKIRDKILNSKKESNILIATVTQVDPLLVELIPDDSPIPAINTNHLFIEVGSRIILQKFLNQFIAIAVIGSPKYPKIVLKIADTNRASDTSYTADPHLTVSLPKGYIWEIKVGLYVIAGTTGRFKTSWTLAGSASYNLGDAYSIHGGIGIGTSASDAQNATYMRASAVDMQTYPTTGFGYGAMGGSSWGDYIEETLFISTLSGAGSITMNWGQYSSSATNTTLKKGSWLKATPVFL